METGGESSTESSSCSSSSSSSSSSDEECRPAPMKKLKKTPKKSPQKKLAKNAAKKGDCKSEKTILELAEEAMRIESEAVGKEMEENLVKFQQLLIKWKENDVEEENIQRFAARFLGQLKTLDILCAVDTAIFKKEIGVIRLLEMDITSMDSSMDRPRLNERSNQLLSMVVDTDRNQLDQTREGTAWTLNRDGSTMENAG